MELVSTESLRIELIRRFGRSREEIRFFRAPGRVDWLGSHTDYNRGLILSSSVNMEIRVAIRKRNDRMLNLYSINANNEVRVHLDNNKPEQAHGWANYPKGVIYELEKAGIYLQGADLVFGGNLPQGANLSSSAALEAVTCEAIVSLTEKFIPRWERVFICHRAENQFVGLPCGILDQVSVYIPGKNHVLFLNCDTLEAERIPIKESNYQILVVDSSVKRELIKSAYHKRVDECKKALFLIRKKIKGVESLSALTKDHLGQLKKILPDLLFRRVRHIITENQRVLEAVSAIKKGDYYNLGKLFDEGYKSSSRDYENSSKELDLLYELLSLQKEVLGTRIAGAGWGGCLMSLVEKSGIDKIKKTVGEKYLDETGINAKFYPVSTAEIPNEIINDT